LERLLIESENYTISNEYETVYLTFKKTNKKIVIGDFYGDPESAFISVDESYCVMGGCGLIIYYLKEPFEIFEYHKKSEQWKELFREKDSIWWIKEIKEGNTSKSVEFIIDECDGFKSDIYEINVYSLEITKIN